VPRLLLGRLRDGDVTVLLEGEDRTRSLAGR
jgi:hypothetical protein